MKERLYALCKIVFSGSDNVCTCQWLLAVFYKHDKQEKLCVISGFGREVDGNCALLGHYE